MSLGLRTEQTLSLLYLITFYVFCPYLIKTISDLYRKIINRHTSRTYDAPIITLDTFQTTYKLRLNHSVSVFM